MVKLIGKKKINVSVFISGRGSNLKSLINFSRKSSQIRIKLVISNNKNAKGLDFANKNNIKFKIINYKNKNLAENKILRYLKKNNVKLILLAGFMKILSKKFTDRFKNRILNIHPSLLPKYKGLETHKKVLKNKENYTGCTIHLVNSKLDSGKIILQKKIKVFKNDNEITLSKRLLKVENKLYPKAVKKYLETNL